MRATYAQSVQRIAEGDQIPASVRAFIEATGVYESPLALPSGETLDRYALRSRLRDALFAEPASEVSASEFHAAVALAATDSAAGRELRRLLAEAPVSWRVISQHTSA